MFYGHYFLANLYESIYIVNMLVYFFSFNLFSAVKTNRNDYE